VNLAEGPARDIKGDILDHWYTIEDGRTKVTEVSKRWFRDTIRGSVVDSDRCS